ncbi:hypothetical protein BSKO_10319 [Bryopsis sp. KO-2023]|nr:hypothetical protein BSKO_10319 [Bryopsis sp. KO-2023]
MWASKRALSPEQHTAWKSTQSLYCSDNDSICGPEPDEEDDDVFVVARMMLGESALNSSGLLNTWEKSKNEPVSVLNSAKKTRNAAKLKTLQRTPYPMILNRIKMLLERLLEMDLDTRAMTPNLLTGRSGSGGTNPAMSVNELVETPNATEAIPFSPKSGPSTSTAQATPSKSSSKDYILSELSLVLSYVSEFLGKLPDETRRSMCSVTKMEHYKKDEVIFYAGDEPDKFYIILTGIVEVREKVGAKESDDRTAIATLKKGQSFGDNSILNNSKRGSTCVSVGNCTFLTVGKTDFIQVFGPYFFEQKRLAMKFLMSKVHIFKDVSRELFFSLVLYTIKSEYPESREWEVSKEKYIYFLIKGTCTLELIDKRSPIGEPKNVMRGEYVPTVGESGVLANVEVHEGRAVGTLGKEEQIKAIRRSLTPKKTLAKLGPGSWFGGGPQTLGEGDIQTSLKVIADTNIEAYVISVDDFLKFADPEIVRWVMPPFQKNSCLFNLKENETPSRFSQQTEGIFSYIRQMRENCQTEIDQAQYDKGTPAERYWATPNFTNTNVQNRLGPILRFIYSDGLGPLADKVDRLDLRSERNDKKAEEDEFKWFWELDSSPAETPRDLFPTNVVGTRDESQNKRDGRHSPELTRPHTSMGRLDDTAGPTSNWPQEKELRPQTATGSRRKQKGELTAACIMWERMSRPQTPGLRQCLTYAEIFRNRRDETRLLFGFAEEEPVDTPTQK